MNERCRKLDAKSMKQLKHCVIAWLGAGRKCFVKALPPKAGRDRKKPHGHSQMEDSAVTRPLAPDASRLISGFCSSPRSFGLGFLQTPPHDNALALLLAFGSAKTWP